MSQVTVTRDGDGFTTTTWELVIDGENMPAFTTSQLVIAVEAAAQHCSPDDADEAVQGLIEALCDVEVP